MQEISMKCQTRKYFCQEFKYFFSIVVLHTVVLLSLLLLKFQKRFRKRLFIGKRNYCIKYYFFPYKIKNRSPFRTDVSIRFLAFRTLGAVATRKRERSWNQWEHWYQIRKIVGTIYNKIYRKVYNQNNS